MDRRAVLVGFVGLTGSAVLARPDGSAGAWVLGAEPISHAQLSRSSATAWSAFNSCRYDELARALPHLVQMARAACESASGS